MVVHLGHHHRAVVRDGELPLGDHAPGAASICRARDRLRDAGEHASWQRHFYVMPAIPNYAGRDHADERRRARPDAARLPASGGRHRSSSRSWIADGAQTTDLTDSPTTECTMRRLALLRARRRPAARRRSAGARGAYPQFQFSSGTNRCSQCHYSPAGGGLITSWGRDESGDTISLGGDGAFLHGLWAPPSWLALGADFRLAAPLVNDSGGAESPDGLGLPDAGRRLRALRLRRSASRCISQGGDRAASCGPTRRSAPRSTPPPRSPHLARALPDVAAERDRALRARGALLRPLRPALRRAHLLRAALHRLQPLRRDLQPVRRLRRRGLGAARDRVRAAAGELPRSAAVGRRRESGRRRLRREALQRDGALALQARVGIGQRGARYQGGAVGKLWVEPAKLLFLGEADFIRQIEHRRHARPEPVRLLPRRDLLPIRGLMVGVAYERFQEDLSVAGPGATRSTSR